MMSKSQVSAGRFNSRRAEFEPKKRTSFEANIYERWNSRLDDARKLVAAQIVESVKTKWGTAVALEEATGICQTEISRSRHGNFDRFSLERLVRLLWIVDPDVEVELELKVVAKKGS